MAKLMFTEIFDKVELPQNSKKCDTVEYADLMLIGFYGFILLLLFIGIIFFAGCTTKTIIQTPDDSRYLVKSKYNSSVTFKNKNTEITVDNRGNKNVFESFTSYMIAKPNINIGGE